MSAFDPKPTLGSQSARLNSLRKAWSSRRAHAATPVHRACWRHGHRMAAGCARAADGRQGACRNRVSQIFVEDVLREEVAALPSVTLQSGWRMIALRETEAAVEVDAER